MATTSRPAKAKRKLSEITFEHEGAHVALTSKSQDGPANGHDYALVMKSRSKEFIQKVQAIQVTLELPEFLRKFFGMYYEDAEVLARLMGYVEQEDPEDESEDESEDEDYYTKYINERLAAFEIIKQLKQADEQNNLEVALASLEDDKYLALLEDQAKIEQLEKSALLKLTSKSGGSTNVEKPEVEPTGSKVTKSKVKSKDKKMEIEQLEKANADLAVELKKAQALIEEMRAAEKQKLVKARTEKVKAVVDSEAVLKAALALEADEDFDAFVASLETLKKAVAAAEKNSDAFKEIGAEGEVKPEVKKSTRKSGVAALLKSENK